MRLRDKVAIVTGASRGIGAEVCKAYAREGASVVINFYSHPDEAQSLARTINSEGGKAVTVEGDVSRAEDVHRIVQICNEAFGAADILVNNAAHYPRSAWHEITEESWDRVMAVNLKGALLCCQAVYPGMRDKGYGKIINVSSVTVELGWGPYVHYVSSKAGLIGFTRSLAREVGKEGIRVNCVMPGAIQTEQELEDFPDQDDLAIFLAERQCLPQRGTARDMVGAFVYLASPESDFVTGQVLSVDGGWNHY